MLSTIYKKIGGIKGIVLILYTVFALSLSIIATRPRGQVKILILVAAVVSILVCPIILKWASKLSIKNEDNKISTKTVGIIFFVIPLCLFLINYIINFPGGFLNDSVVQYKQVIWDNYNDWHPFINAFLFMKIPMQLTNNWVGSIVLFQLIIFSFIISYVVTSIYKHTNLKYTLIGAAFLLLNPQTINLGICVLKDTVFAMGTLLLMAYAMHIYFTRGEWAKRKRNIVAMIIVFTITSLCRHNAPLFTIPLFIVIFIMIDKRRAIITLAGVILAIALIKIPLFSFYDVKQPQRRSIETLGVPVNIIGSVAKYDSKSLDKDAKEYIFKLAPKETWDNKYKYGKYNRVKWKDGTNNDVTETYDSSKILAMAGKSFAKSPYVGIKCYARLSGVVFTVADVKRFIFHPEVYKEYGDVTFKGIKPLAKAWRKTYRFINRWLPFLFVYVGVMQLILLVSILAKCRLRTKEGWLKAWLILPVFAYNIGTSFLLTDARDASRFFYYTFALMPILLAILYRKEIKKEDD